MVPTNLFFIVWTLGLLIALSFPIYQIFENRAIRAATKCFGKQLQQNPTLGEAVAQTLYKPIERMNVTPGQDTKNVANMLTSLPFQADEFLIRYRQWVSADSYLFITTVDYRRPYPDRSFWSNNSATRGNFPATKITYNLNFVVKLDTPKKQVVVFSDLYSTVVDKNLRVDFAQVIFKLLRR